MRNFTWNRFPIKICWSIPCLHPSWKVLLQSSPKEDHNTFRTTPREHWWIWPECPRHAQINN